jgi:two-component system LytT family sensor kinase
VLFENRKTFSFRNSYIRNDLPVNLNGNIVLMLRTKNLWIIHLLGWLLFLSLPLTIMSREPEPKIQLVLLTSGSLWLFFVIYSGLFYFNVYVLIPRLFLQQKYVLYTGIFVIGFVAVYFTQPFENLVFQKFHQQQPGERTEMHPGPPPPRDFDERAPQRPPQRESRNVPAVDFVSLILFVVVWVVAMAVKISEQWRLSEKKVILSEADKAQAELSFFKAQINPHFLFNTLNNIYALAVSKSDNTAASILKLSQMMRYITEEAMEDFVPLDDEIACLKNYIDLQKLRLNAKTTVWFDVNGSATSIRIAPLILMTFVENAFKYGVSNRRETDIKVKVDIVENDILFFCQNRIIDVNADTERKGIGIANTKKRLDFLYVNRHILKIENDAEMFTVHLKLTAV